MAAPRCRAVAGNGLRLCAGKRGEFCKARTLAPSLGGHHESLTRERCPPELLAPYHEFPTRSPRPTAHKAPHPGSSNAPALVQGLTDLGAGVSHVPLPATAEKCNRSWRALALKRLGAGRGRGPPRPIPLSRRTSGRAAPTTCP